VHSICPDFVIFIFEEFHMLFMQRTLAALLFSACAMTAQAQPANSLTDGRVGRTEFASITSPSHLEYARLDLTNTRVATVSGELIMPRNYQTLGRVPAVVLTHGSGGVESNMYDVWAKELNAAGYAVFIIDSLKPRGVGDILSDQSLVSLVTQTADTQNALSILTTHPLIDAKKIYNMGFSRGGSVAFDTAWPTWQRPVNTNGARFAGHVAWYPGNCNIRHRSDDREKTTAPMLVLYAEHDLEESQNVRVCQRWMDELIAKGNDIRHKEYKGARHGFDGLNFAYRVVPRTSGSRKCDMEVYVTPESDGTPGRNGFDFKQNKPITTHADFRSSLDACIERGTVTGTRGGWHARAVQAEAVRDALEFLRSIK
jgi:dienelactone hydrolase